MGFPLTNLADFVIIVVSVTYASESKRAESEVQFGEHTLLAVHILCDFSAQDEPTFANRHDVGLFLLVISYICAVVNYVEICVSDVSAIRNSKRCNLLIFGTSGRLLRRVTR
jgi:hypothetical protein